jgi:hypothetical protein
LLLILQGLLLFFIFIFPINAVLQGLLLFIIFIFPINAV